MVSDPKNPYELCQVYIFPRHAHECEQCVWVGLQEFKETRLRPGRVSIYKHESNGADKNPFQLIYNNNGPGAMSKNFDYPSSSHSSDKFDIHHSCLFGPEFVKHLCFFVTMNTGM